MDEIFEWALGTGWYYQPVPKALHRYRVVIFILVPGGTTNRCLWMSLRYRLVLPTGTLGSSMDYLKRKISIFPSDVMCRRDGKKGTCEARDPKFESWPTIFAKNIALGTSSFTRCWWSRLLVSVTGYRFKNWYLWPLLTGTYRLFSSSEYEGASNGVGSKGDLKPKNGFGGFGGLAN